MKKSIDLEAEFYQLLKESAKTNGFQRVAGEMSSCLIDFIVSNANDDIQLITWKDAFDEYFRLMMDEKVLN